MNTAFDSSITTARAYMYRAIYAPSQRESRHYARLTHITGTAARDHANTQAERTAAAAVLTTALDILS